MRNYSLLLLPVLTVFTVSAKEIPKQPWSDYKVHDESRPHPDKVETKGAITTPPPSDAIVLFDGKDTSAFDKEWKVEEGRLVATEIGNLKTKKSFQDCQVHIEWRIPAGREVDGQKGGNSGVFLMGLYEVQVQESHTNVTYADGQAGAIYGQFPPLKNASTAQGEWQSYDITFIAPRYNAKGLVSPAVITVIHNGAVVQAALKLKGPTVFRKVAKYPKKHPERAPIMLQWHEDPVEFRNFWVREL